MSQQDKADTVLLDIVSVTIPEEHSKSTVLKHAKRGIHWNMKLITYANCYKQNSSP